MNESEREKWYAYHHQKFGIPLEYLKRDYEEELSGKVPMEAPLEVPDKMEVLYKYSFGQQSRFFRELRENRKSMAPGVRSAARSIAHHDPTAPSATNQPNGYLSKEQESLPHVRCNILRPARLSGKSPLYVPMFS